jgi:hypothetical protein
MKSVSIKNTLPEDELKVLVYAPFWVSIGMRYKGKWLTEMEIPFEERGEYWDSKDITHWMKIPKINNTS